MNQNFKPKYTARLAYGTSLQKVLRDSWLHRSRTRVVVLTISISVFILGALYMTWSVLSTDLSAGYLASNPADALLVVHEPFGRDMLAQIEKLPEVAAAEGRYIEQVHMQVGAREAEFLHLFAVDDFENIHLDAISSDFGSWPPETGGVLLERSSMNWLFGDAADPYNAQRDGMGAQLNLTLSTDQVRSLTVVGQIHDVIHPPSNLSNNAYGYITMNTLRHLTSISGYNMVLITAPGDASTDAEISAAADATRTLLENQGYIVVNKELREPGLHPLNNIIETMVFILGALGLLGLILSAILIVNTISTLQATQVKQVGIMKTLGAAPSNVFAISMGVIFLLGMAAVVIAMPVTYMSARVFTFFAADLINIELNAFEVPFSAYLLQLAIGLLFPLFIAIFPIVRGSRITVREAISDNVSSQQEFGQSGFDKLLNSIGGLPISVRYALRNIFRRKAQLFFVIVVLSVAGAIFIATVSLRQSLLLTQTDISNYWQQDIRVMFTRPYRNAKIDQVTSNINMIDSAEGRVSTEGFLIDAVGVESKRTVTIEGLAIDSQFVAPTIVDGRWIEPNDEQAIVVNVNVLQDNPNIAVGDWITLRLNGRESSWEVVGIVTSQVIGNSDFLAAVAYTTYDGLAPHISQSNQYGQLVIQADPTAMNTQSEGEIIQSLEDEFAAAGIRTYIIHTYDHMRATLGTLFAIPVTLTFVMTLPFSIVGGLGLMGMMSLSVMQRTRELGVVRALGSTDIMVAKIILTEGIITGASSWIFGVILAYPLSRYLSDTVGYAFLNSALNFSFPPIAAVLWLVCILLLASISSLVPALTAAQLSVRDALNYE